jgi:hypothetical protein
MYAQLLFYFNYFGSLWVIGKKKFYCDTVINLSVKSIFLHTPYLPTPHIYLLNFFINSRLFYFFSEF